MIAAHLPVLVVLIPLVAAPICILLRHRSAAWTVAILASFGSVVISVQLLVAVLNVGIVSYTLGGWAAPWGIELRVDALNAYVILLVTIVAAVVLVYAPASVAAEIPEDQTYLFYATYLLCLTGLLGITVTGDAFNVFVFLEISSLSSYALISLGKDRRALSSAYHYLILGSVGATFILIGIGMLYMTTGTLNMADLAQRLGPISNSRTVLVAFAFMTVGMAIKLALFPLHSWLPNAYCYAPSVVSAFLAATATKVSIYIFLRFVFTIYGVDYAFGVMRIDVFLVPLSILAIFVASTVAIFQVDIKRMLAYSSLAQIGYIMLGISLASNTGLTAGIVHLFNHALTKAALFLALGGIALRLGSTRIEALQGIGKRMPVTTFGLVCGGLSLIGLPLTVGFISKWYLVLSVMEKGWWPLASTVLLGSLLTIVYFWRIVETAYFQPPPDGCDKVTEMPFSMHIPLWLLLASTIYFGVSTELTAGVARYAATLLMGDAS